SIDAIIEYKNPKKAVFAETVEREGIRSSYALLESPLKPDFDRVRRHGHIMFRDKEGKGISIHDSRLKILKEQVEDFARRGQCTVIMPFHREAGSVGRNISYAKDL